MEKTAYMELFNNLNSKKRNKKILITTEAIEKAVWKAVEEKIATGEFHPKKEESKPPVKRVVCSAAKSL